MARGKKGRIRVDNLGLEAKGERTKGWWKGRRRGGREEEGDGERGERID